MSAAPDLQGHPNAVAKLLPKTAQTDGVTDPVNQTCGGTSEHPSAAPFASAAQ
jgi:hypothetical protein